MGLYDDERAFYLANIDSASSDMALQDLQRLFYAGCLSGELSILGPTTRLASRLTGVHADSNVISGGGTDDTAVLQAALDALELLPSGGTLVLDGAFLVTGLIASLNITILCPNKACGLYLADSSNAPIIRNRHRRKHWTSHVESASAGPPTTITVHTGDGAKMDSVGTGLRLEVYSAGGVYKGLITVTVVATNTLTYTGSFDPVATDTLQEYIEDQNITIIGGTFNGNGHNNTDDDTWPDHPDNDPTWLQGFCFLGCKDLTVRDVTVLNARNYAFLFSNQERQRFDGCRAEWTHAEANNDGVHFWGPLNDVRVNDFYTEGTDDGLALNFAENASLSLTGPYASNGDVTNFVVDGCYFSPSSTTKGVRIMGHSDYIANDILLRNIGGSVSNQNSMTLYGGTRVGRLEIDGWAVGGTGAFSTESSAVTIAQFIMRSMVRTAWASSGAPIQLNLTTDSLIIDDLVIECTSKITHGITLTGGTIDRLIVNGASAKNLLALVKNTAATVNSLRLTGLVLDTVDYEALGVFGTDANHNHLEGTAAGYNDIVVAGTSTPNVAGTYVYAGQVAGYPSWNNGTYTIQYDGDWGGYIIVDGSATMLWSRDEDIPIGAYNPQSGSTGAATGSGGATLVWRPAIALSGDLAMVDGTAAPDAVVGKALIYVDVADGDLKVKFGDGTVKVIAADT